MTDRIITVGNSAIQHGPLNNRVYLMKLAHQDCPEIINKLDQLASSHSYSKIFAKVPSTALAHFIDHGYEREATVPGLSQSDDTHFLGKYFTAERRHEREPELIQSVLSTACQQQRVGETQLTKGCICRIADEHDTDDMAQLYREVFASYPFPIFDSSYLQSVMGSTVFFGIWRGKQLVALSSAEIDRNARNVEMTDFATRPDWRGHNLALYLLQKMEQAMELRGIHSFYTIARAYSHGMNITFARNGYAYAGTLTNNTNIFGSLESMNIWHKGGNQHELAGTGETR